MKGEYRKSIELDLNHLSTTKKLKEIAETYAPELYNLGFKSPKEAVDFVNRYKKWKKKILPVLERLHSKLVHSKKDMSEPDEYHDVTRRVRSLIKNIREDRWREAEEDDKIIDNIQIVRNHPMILRYRKKDVQVSPQLEELYEKWVNMPGKETVIELVLVVGGLRDITFDLERLNEEQEYREQIRAAKSWDDTRIQNLEAQAKLFQEALYVWVELREKVNKELTGKKRKMWDGELTPLLRAWLEALEGKRGDIRETNFRITKVLARLAGKDGKISKAKEKARQVYGQAKENREKKKTEKEARIDQRWNELYQRWTHMPGKKEFIEFINALKKINMKFDFDELENPRYIGRIRSLLNMKARKLPSYIKSTRFFLSKFDEFGADLMAITINEQDEQEGKTKALSQFELFSDIILDEKQGKLEEVDSQIVQILAELAHLPGPGRIKRAGGAFKRMGGWAWRKRPRMSRRKDVEQGEGPTQMGEAIVDFQTIVQNLTEQIAPISKSLELLKEIEHLGSQMGVAGVGYFMDKKNKGKIIRNLIQIGHNQDAYKKVQNLLEYIQKMAYHINQNTNVPDNVKERVKEYDIVAMQRVGGARANDYYSGLYEKIDALINAIVA